MFGVMPPFPRSPFLSLCRAAFEGLERGGGLEGGPEDPPPLPERCRNSRRRRFPPCDHGPARGRGRRIAVVDVAQARRRGVVNHARRLLENVKERLTGRGPTHPDGDEGEEGPFVVVAPLGPPSKRASAHHLELDSFLTGPGPKSSRAPCPQ